MEITADLYAWLTSIDLFDLTSNFSINDSGNVIIEKPYADKIKNGTFFIPLFEKLNEMLNATYGNIYKMDEKIYQLADSSILQIRMKNWTIIKDFIKNFYGIDLKDDDKTLIIADDTQSFVNLFTELFGVYSSLDEKLRNEKNSKSLKEKFELSQQNSKLPLDLREINKMNEQTESYLRNESRESKVSRGSKISQSKQNTNQIQKLKNYPDSVDINEINPLKEISHTRSVLEFIILTLCRSLKMKPRQASALLSDGKKYLHHIIIKGLKSNYAPIKTWFTEILVNYEHFLNLIEINSITHPNQISRNIEMSLSCFVSGLLSKNYEVVNLCGRVLTKLAYEFTEMNLISVAWDWFVMPNGGLEACIYCLIKHNNSVEVVVSLITNFGRFHLYELFNLYLKTLIPNEGAYFAFLADILERLSEIKFFCDEFVKNNIKQYFIDLAVNYSVSLNNNIKLHIIQFLSELWISFSFYIEEEEGNTILNVLKKLSRDKHKLLAFSAITQLFRILETFAKQRNKFAPIIYKSITFLLIEIHSSNEIKEFIISNFKHIFSTFLNIPVSIMIEPLVKQVSTSLNHTYFFNLIDINFLIKLSMHPKLNIRDAILILDILGKIYFENINFYRVIRGVFTMILSRYLMNEIGLEFAVKYCKVLVEAFCKLDKNYSEKVYSLALAHNMNPEDQEALLKIDLNIDKNYASFLIELTKSVIIEMLVDILNINNKYLNNVLRSIFLIADMRHYNIYSFHNIGLGRVIDYFGDHINIQSYFQVNKEEFVKDPEFEAAIHLIYDKIPEKKDKNLVVKNFLPPKGGMNKKAEESIEKLREKKEEINNLKFFKDELLKQKQELLKDSMKKANSRMSLELGYKKNILNNNNNNLVISKSNKLITSEGKSLANKYNIILQYNVDLLDLTNEEDRDIIHLKKALKDYSRFFKFIFQRYCGSIYHPINGKTFNSIKEINETISPSELLKIFKDHEVDHNLIKKDEILLIIGLMNVKLYHRKNSKSGLNYDQFIETFIQIANFAFSKNVYNYPNYSISQFTIEMIKLFEKNNENNGILCAEYKHPNELLTITEKEITKSLNLKLMINSMITLPDGYKKYLDTEIKQYYYLPDCIYKVAGKSFKISIEILDDLLFEIFGFHILESFTRVKEIYKARPLFTKNIQDKLEKKKEILKKIFYGGKDNKEDRLNDLAAIKRNHNLTKENSKRDLKKILNYDKSKFNDSNYEDDEVKMIFDDLENFSARNITTAENNDLFEDFESTVSKTKSKRAIINNQAKLAKIKEEEESKIIEREKEKKRKLREQYIKTELEKLRIIKEEKMIKREMIEEAEKAKKNEIQRKKIEQETKLREKIKEELETIRKLKLLQAKEKLKLESNLNKSFSKSRQNPNLNEVFYNKETKKLKEQFKTLAEERKNNELKKILKDFNNQIKIEEEKKKLEAFYSEEKKIYSKEKQIFHELNKKLEDKDILMTFDKYGEHINMIFEMYSKCRVNNNLEDDNFMFQDEFQMFCVHFNIANLLIDNDQILFIFKKLSNKEHRQNSLDFNDFILSLIYMNMFSLSKFIKIPKENNTYNNEKHNLRPSSLGPSFQDKRVRLDTDKLENKKNQIPHEGEKGKVTNPNDSLNNKNKSRSNIRPQKSTNDSSNIKPSDKAIDSSNKSINLGNDKFDNKQKNTLNTSINNTSNNHLNNKSINLENKTNVSQNKILNNNRSQSNSSSNISINKEKNLIDKETNKENKNQSIKKNSEFNPDYTKQIKFFKNINETNLTLLNSKVLEKFFEFLEFEIPFSRSHIQNYINNQKKMSVKDKIKQTKVKSLSLLQNDE